MRKLRLALLGCLFPMVVAAAGDSVHLDHASVDLKDQASLQRGAQLFVNYCLSCHGAHYMRYKRMGEDLGIPEELVRENLIFTDVQIGDTMTVAMTADDGKKWFGTPPPDLSLVGRSRGADWLYTYLRGFYIDESRPFGVNNVVFPDVGMPHVLADLQGKQMMEDHKLTLTEPGSMSAEEYDQAITDLVNFLAYVGEPAALIRYSLGVKVLLFLLVLLPIVYLLKKEYWKDAH